MNQPTTNRRDLLRLATTAAAYTAGAAIVTGGVAAVSVAATPGASAAWDAAMRNLATVQAASDDYDRNHIVLPANGPERTAAIKSISDDVWAESEEFAGAVADAESDLMGMPAPQRQALLWKLEKLLEITGDSTPSWSADYAAQTLADMRRLLAGEVVA